MLRKINICGPRSNRSRSNWISMPEMRAYNPVNTCNFHKASNDGKYLACKPDRSSEDGDDAYPFSLSLNSIHQRVLLLASGSAAHLDGQDTHRQEKDASDASDRGRTADALQGDIVELKPFPVCLCQFLSCADVRRAGPAWEAWRDDGAWLDDGENSLADRRVVSNTWPGSGLFRIVA